MIEIYSHLGYVFTFMNDGFVGKIIWNYKKYIYIFNSFLGEST